MGAFLVIALGICLQACFIIVEHKEKYVPAVILKGSASLMFIILGFLTKEGCADVSFAKAVFIGLILGGVGDVLLNLRFVFEKIGQKIFLVGIVAFLAGHIMYLAALIPLAQNLIFLIAIGVVVAAALLYFIFHTLGEIKIAFKIFGIFYIGAIAIMTVIAIGNLISMPCMTTVLYALGAVLFLASDVVLIFNTFGREQKFSLRIANLSLYYLGQILIAVSLHYFI